MALGNIASIFSSSSNSADKQRRIQLFDDTVAQHPEWGPEEKLAELERLGLSEDVPLAKRLQMQSQEVQNAAEANHPGALVNNPHFYARGGWMVPVVKSLVEGNRGLFHNQLINKLNNEKILNQVGARDINQPTGGVSQGGVSGQNTQQAWPAVPASNDANSGEVGVYKVPPFGMLPGSVGQFRGVSSQAENVGTDRNQLGRNIYNYFVDKGLQPHQAAAIAGNMVWESGGSINNVTPGDNWRNSPTSPHSMGIGQWNDRVPALINFARSQGIDIPQGDIRNVAYAKQAINLIPLKTQLDYSWNEMQGPENRAFQRIVSAGDLNSAAQGAISYHRPAGWSWQYPSNGHGFNNRVGIANKILSDASRVPKIQPPGPEDAARFSGYRADPSSVMSNKALVDDLPDELKKLRALGASSPSIKNVVAPTGPRPPEGATASDTVPANEQRPPWMPPVRSDEISPQPYPTMPGATITDLNDPEMQKMLYAQALGYTPQDFPDGSLSFFA